MPHQHTWPIFLGVLQVNQKKSRDKKGSKKIQQNNPNPNPNPNKQEEHTKSEKQYNNGFRTKTKEYIENKNALVKCYCST